MIDAPFGNEHPLDLAQRQVRVARQLERMRQDDEVEAGRIERQGVEVAAQVGGAPRAARSRRGCRCIGVRRLRIGAGAAAGSSPSADSTASQRCGMRLARSASSCGKPSCKA